MRPFMNNGGAIINISSRSGSIGALQKDPKIPSLPAYGSSKGALNNLTVQWALQEKKNGSGIRVVSITPGIFYYDVGYSCSLEDRVQV
jgi:NAD(P)-dependent dehydrogenase (short-subunit alcohol dehydrogenase family)